jgi:hypothetical protein
MTVDSGIRSEEFVSSFDLACSLANVKTPDICIGPVNGMLTAWCKKKYCESSRIALA